MKDRFRGSGRLIVAAALLPALLSSACGPPAALDQRGSAQADQHDVPFRGDGGLPAKTGGSSTQTSPPEPDLPFRNPKNLPAGTLLTVRLKNSIVAEGVNANTAFQAVVDEPIEVGGGELVPAGAVVSGRVEAARASNLKRDTATVRLTLESIDFSGTKLPLQTSSLFVSGKPRANRNPQRVSDGDESTAVRIEKGRRLVFRLTEPAYLASGRGATATR